MIEDRLLALEKAMAALMPRSTLNKVKIKPVRSPDAPANYKGCTVNFGNGNYRLVKRIQGKQHCIHVGKVWSESAADAALARKGITITTRYHLVLGH